jgi:hypothetical protein
MSEKIEVERGTKVEDEDFKKVDKSKLAILLAAAPADDVAGQWHSGLTQCPWCGNVGWTRHLSDWHATYVICGFCGHGFTVLG